MKNYIYLLGLGVIGLVACQKNYQAKPSDINNNYRITKFVSDSNDVISIQYTNDGRLSKIFSIDKHGIMHKDGYFEYSGNVVIKHTNSGEPYEWVTLNASGKPSTRITYKGYASNKPSIKFFDTLAYFYNNEGELKSLRAAADINSDTSKAFARVNYITVVEKDGDVTDVYSEKNELLAHFEYDTEHLNDLNMYVFGNEKEYIFFAKPSKHLQTSFYYSAKDNGQVIYEFKDGRISSIQGYRGGIPTGMLHPNYEKY